jgi:hypothetical protein
MLDGIDLGGFSTPVTIRWLRENRCSGLPPKAGVYVVIRDTSVAPTFLKISGAGWFKDRDPSYGLDVVQEGWVDGARIVYVGMSAAEGGLKERVSRLVSFAYGKRASHSGGRMLWHLSDWESLQLRWLTCAKAEANPRETTLISQFRRVHETRPFGNQTK